MPRSAFLPPAVAPVLVRKLEAGAALPYLSEDQGALLASVSNAMVRLHKEQFGRGPTNSRSSFAGPDALVCVLSDVLLPAERKMVSLGQQDRVRDSRTSFQAATETEFRSAVEQIVQRKVIAFASGIDPDNNVIFENFLFAAVDRDGAEEG